MQNLIGKKLEYVVSLLEKSNEKYEIVDNNHNVMGDTTLVTNIQKKDNVYKITTGEFIFDVKGNKDEKENRWNKITKSHSYNNGW